MSEPDPTMRDPIMNETLPEMETLPDYLREGLSLVFVGLNPSQISVEAGHYFANPRNRFWTAFNLAGLVDREFRPEDDAALPDYGIGLTDVVKRPTRQGSGLKAEDYRRWAPVLKEKLLLYRPKLVCFHGLMAYKAYLRYAEGLPRESPGLGLQDRRIGDSQVFVVPNPSPANAKYSVNDLAAWYRRLSEFREGESQ